MAPTTLLFYLAAFVVALGVLIVVHEFGHFAVARLCGVKVLRFSVGFGRPLAMRRFGRDGTEWAISAFPLGGYVKMLDESEAPVPAEDIDRAFNRQSVGKRILIVLAGPVANLLLAVFLYWVVFVLGVEELRPVLDEPSAASPAAVAGIHSGETVRTVNGKSISTWQEFSLEIVDLALRHEAAVLETENRAGEAAVRRVEVGATASVDEDLLARLGLRLNRPLSRPVVGEVLADSPAAASGIRAGDLLLTIDGKPTPTSADVTRLVRDSGGRSMAVDFRRGAETLHVQLTPRETPNGGERVWRIGVQFRDDPAAHIDMSIVVRYGPAAAVGRAIALTSDWVMMDLRIIGRMIGGEVSPKNISGPVAIAEFAGQSARLGTAHYLKFLALISISLGVLNLLPIPILDGGHLLYYLAEIIRGRPLPDRVAELGRQVGFALLILLMVFALYNDINRLIPG